ncbi:MAG: FtsQ-type POTRA domain-containing protein [Microbacterium sp.]
MRRPAPLPVPAQSAGDPYRPVGDGDGPEETAGDDAPAPVPLRSPEEPSPAPSEISSADVWRAARARRKALRAEIRRFTQRSRRRRMVWLVAASAVVLLVAGSLVAAYSPLFAVQRITVVGAKSLDAAAVEQALSGQLGAPIAQVDSSKVKAALTAFPLIESYSLEAHPPHDLTVRIVERTPIGVLESGAGYTLVDAAGVALSTTEARPEGQPLLEIAGGVHQAAFQSAGRVVRALPAEVRASVTEVRASTADDVTLVLNDAKTVVWGSAEGSAEKSIVLSDLMKAKPDASSFDVSSPSVPVVG